MNYNRMSLMKNTLSLFAVSVLFSVSCALPTSARAETALPVPTPEQAAWQDQEIGMFFHFDLPVFTEGGKGNGSNWQSCGNLDSNIFNPQKLDTDQWMEAPKAVGAKYTVFVAKHCSGFILWQSDAYPYGRSGGAGKATSSGTILPRRKRPGSRRDCM